ncbi:PKD domain-containing protein [Mycetocola sp. 2940]|uniref:PKD domain-containing protein n=1 Tax=Mycetocola sp. 2940 TaxID=3156452 RepID=UPI0033954BC5
MRIAKSFAAGAAGAALVLSLAAIPALSQGPKPAVAELAATPDAVHFTASGDFGTNQSASDVLNEIKAIGPDFHVALGDLSYGEPGTEQSWCDFVTSRVGAGFPFELLTGNHESNGEDGAINNFSACLPNQLPGVIGTYGQQYYVDVPQVNPLVRYIGISPNLTFPDGIWSYAAGTPRYQWTESAIDSARAANIPWVVVAMHKPCLSIGMYTCEVGPAIANLLVSKKVDLVLSGHEHLYGRTHQLAHSTACTAVNPGSYNPACVADADNAMSKGAGTVFGIVGTGGQVLRNVNLTDTETNYFASSSGLNKNPAYGNIDVQATPGSLTARFAPIPGASFTDQFTITAGAPPANTPPTASFTASCSNLDCAVDGRASTDPDGSIAGYAWAFGDGGTATGAQASHTYATAGSKTISLTVTDNLGATATTTRTVTVTSPPPAGSLAADTFNRTVTNGFGTADSGGAWTTSGSATAFSVSAGAGRIRFATPGVTNAAYLNAVSSNATDLTFRVSSDKAASGSGTYVTAVGRRVGSTAAYQAKMVMRSDGRATIALERTAGTAVTVIAPGILVPGLTIAAGDSVTVRMSTVGVSPTTVQAKVWKTGTPEPSAWHRTMTDSTAALQVAGSVGVSVYLSSSSTTAPVVVSIDDLVAVRP